MFVQFQEVGVWGWYVCTIIPGPGVHEISFGKIWKYKFAHKCNIQVYETQIIKMIR